jgi:7-cyano-7-deazaguanine synthase
VAQPLLNAHATIDAILGAFYTYKKIEHLELTAIRYSGKRLSTVRESTRAETKTIRLMIVPQRVILLLSGGLDSVVLLHLTLSQGCHVHSVLLDYGQKHKRELDLAKWHCHQTGTLYSLLAIPQIPGSSLTDGTGSKVVPNRNAIFISFAVSVAMNAKADSVVFAANQDDATDFPDCRKEFVEAMSKATRLAAGVEVCAPFINTTKKQIVEIGRKLGVDFSRTWSCYQGNFDPCGVCDACVKRAEAMA